MDCETVLARIRELNRNRQKRYYDTHREALNTKRRERYAKGKPEIIEPDEHEQENQEQNEETHQFIDLSKEKKLTYEEAKEYFNQLTMNENSRKKYLGDLKRLSQIIKCDNFILCFKQHKKILNQINEANYAINTKKSVLQTILFMNTRFKLELPKNSDDAYKREFDILKDKSLAEGEVKSKRETMSFTEYLAKIKEKFGADSKMYVIARLYDELTLRDDFVLEIVDSMPTDKTKNFIVMGKKVTVVINVYKTSSKYKEIVVNLTAGLATLIKKYIKDNKLEVGQYLFGNKKLSPFISKKSKEVGMMGGVNELRHMKVTDELKGLTSEQKVDLSFKMKHSPLVQSRYLRNK